MKNGLSLIDRFLGIEKKYRYGRVKNRKTPCRQSNQRPGGPVDRALRPSISSSSRVSGYSPAEARQSIPGGTVRLSLRLSPPARRCTRGCTVIGPFRSHGKTAAVVSRVIVLEASPPPMPRIAPSRRRRRVNDSGMITNAPCGGCVCGGKGVFVEFATGK